MQILSKRVLEFAGLAIPSVFEMSLMLGSDAGRRQREVCGAGPAGYRQGAIHPHQRYDTQGEAQNA